MVSNPEISYYFPHNETYEVTNIVSGAYINVLKHLETQFNFSTKLYLRKDRTWGIPKTMPNGTIQFSGMLKSIKEDPVDLICSTFSLVNERFKYVDFLIPMTYEYVSLYIAKQDKYEMVDWILYLTPFSAKIWLIISVNSIAFMVIITIIKKLYADQNVKIVSC